MPIILLTGADLNNQRAINGADPVDPTDLANRQYVDARVNGLTWKQPVVAATTANGTLATAFASGQAVDGVTLVTGQRILVKDQTTQTENGIYVVAASGAPARSADADSTAELHGAAVYVTSGTVNAERAYTQTTESPVIGSSNIIWAQFGGGTLPTAGDGLTITGSTLAVGQGTGITVGADTVGIDTSVVGRKYAVSVGDGSTNPITVTHSLGTTDVDVTILRTSDSTKVMTNWAAPTGNTVLVTFPSAPSSAQYRVIVQG